MAVFHSNAEKKKPLTTRITPGNPSVGKLSPQQGRDIYNYRCYFCHGYNGDARTLAASFLQPPPRDFLQTSLEQLSRDAMIEAVSRGVKGTAMQGFSSMLSKSEVESVVDFVREQFMRRKAANTRYHTEENGWHEHDRKYAAAYPFVLGELALDTPFSSLTSVQRQGWRLFMQGCVSCHDRARVEREGEVWQKRPLSFPRNAYSHQQPDAVSAASVYAGHEKDPVLGELDPDEQAGREFFNANCAFCHGRDGSGQNWIGSYIEPHPRDLRLLDLSQWNIERIQASIANGVENSAMPAWRHVLSEQEIRQVAKYVWRLAKK